MDSLREIEQLTLALKQRMDSVPPLSQLCCIYRVPKHLRHTNEKAYTPQVVSIGPLHHGNKNLAAMEEYKTRCLQAFLSRTNVNLEDCILKIKSNEVRLRGCYADPVEFGSDDFVTIILVDAVFIIEQLLWYRYRFTRLQHEDVPVFNRQWQGETVWTDMMLLENQLPFFILEDLWHSYVPKCDMSLLDHFQYCFGSVSVTQIWGLEVTFGWHTKAEHFVDLFRHLLLYQQKLGGYVNDCSIPSATELLYAGVKFKVGRSRSLIDIQFNDGILEIPRLEISGQTMVTIRNLIAFEQCHCTENVMNDYVQTLCRLVSTSDDVLLLTSFGIIENRLGDTTLGSSLINRLADGIILDSQNFYYASLFEALNRYYESHTSRATLMRYLYNKRWEAVSISAILVLILTIIQAVCSIVSLL